MVGLPTAEGVAADLLGGEIDLAAHQPEAPEGIHREGSPEEMDLAAFGGAADVDHVPLERGLEIELPGGRERPAGWSAVDADRGPVAHGSDVAGGLRLEGGHTLVGKARPDLGLPPAIERLDRGLQAGLPRRGEDGGEAEPEAEAHHAAHGIAMLMRALEDIVARCQYLRVGERLAQG